MSVTSIVLPRIESDSAWKDILEVYFQEFMEFFYPALAKKIDWSAGYEVLDKELQAITTDAMIGKRLVDKLIKVHTRSGEEHLVLIHLEVQGQPEAEFALRLFQYHYRLYDRYAKPVLTIAILTDESPNWRPTCYQARVWDTEVLLFRFFSIKLLDYEQDLAILQTSANPFATVLETYLAARQTRQNLDGRLEYKFRLTRRLYERNVGRDAILNLYKFIDYMLALPEDLEIRYNNYIHQLEEERAVAYITSVERIGMQKGILQGLEQGRQEGRQEGLQEGEFTLLLRQLQHKFKLIPEHYQTQLAQASAEQLLILGERVLDAATIDEVFKDTH